jgi:hypothetical protein
MIAMDADATIRRISQKQLLQKEGSALIIKNERGLKCRSL